MTWARARARAAGRQADAHGRWARAAWTRAQGQSDARASVARAGRGDGAHGARGEASGNLSKVPEESRAAGKAREHARRHARARRTQTRARARAEASRRPARAPDGPRRPQTLPEASGQCHERSGMFQIAFADLVRRFRACK